MKKILFLLILVSLYLSAQNHQEQWDKVKNFQEQGLPKSALKVVQDIYQEAKEEGDENDLIKALLYREKYQSMLQEEGYIKAIKDIEKEIQTSKKPSTKLILTSILAEMYNNYLETHRYKISKRTAIQDNNNSDIQTWGSQKLLQKSSQLYLDSLGDEAKEIPIEQYKPILLPSKHSEGLRPTLYDFLAFRALDHFQNERSYLFEPSYTFYIDDKKAFGSESSFIKHQFKSKDKHASKYQTLLIYQKLLKFHQEQKDKKAIEHINLERLEFVYQNFNGANKDRYYLDALNSLESQHPDSEALYYHALYYFKKKEFTKALSYVDQGINSKAPYLSSQLQLLKNRIFEPSLGFSVEEVNLPDENLLTRIIYKNIDKVFVKVIKLSKEEFRRFNAQYGKAQKEYIQTLESYKELQFSLPKAADYKEHSTELSLGQYPLGVYLFIMSKNKNFEDQIIENITTISKIAYLHNNINLMVLDRVSGKALYDLRARFYQESYNKQTKKYEQKLLTIKQSNKKGLIEKPQSNDSYVVEFEYGDDFLSSSRAIYRSPTDQEQERLSHKEVYLFTDRAIYRPAQTLHFKGLAVKHYPHNKPKILNNQMIKISLVNRNGEKKASKSFKTNQFGTFNGTFTLPKGGVTGLFYLQVEEGINGRKNIRVEEYKRPKFEVNFKKLDKQYRLGDKITLQGEAVAYAGNGIDEAKVRYRVYRTAHFPWHQWWRPLPQVANMQIATGEIKTKQNGEFTINFEALIDKSIPKEEQPNFNYKISVDITDSTGETQSASKELTLGFVSIQANMLIDKDLNKNEAKLLLLETSNLNGDFEAVQGKIIIEKFKTQEKVYRKRYWETVDLPSYSALEFKKLFEHYAYQEKVRERSKIQTLDFDTKRSKEILLEGLEQGEYLLTLQTQDQYGTKVNKSKKITIFDEANKLPPYPTQLWQQLNKKSYEVGATATLTIKSTSPKSYAHLTIYRGKDVILEKWIEIKYLAKEIISITKEDRGDLHYQITLIKDNRNYSQSGTIYVPWRDKLTVECLSFRDKLSPNQEEQWRIKIMGENKEPVLAEMLATIYDASLDKFVEHNFNIPTLFPKNYFYYHARWKTDGFNPNTVRYHWYTKQQTSIERIFPQLNWFGFNPIRNRSHGFGSATPVMAEASMVERDYQNPYSGIEELAEVSQEIDEAEKKKAVKTKKSSLKIRKNLNEMMLFNPDLQTDKEGNIIINFKTNGALTRWNFLGFLHSKDLRTATLKKSFITQKELMVTTNLPRFFREGDSIVLSEKIVNMSAKDLNGSCQLELINPLNNQEFFPDQNFSKSFNVKKNSSTVVNFTIKVPNINNVPAIQHTVIVKTEHHSDAEQVIKPILSNRRLVTESLPLWVNAKEERTFTFDRLKENNSTTLEHHRLTLEFSSNPAWYALLSLPYLMEYPHACNEQLFSRYFANALAKRLANKSPNIKNIFESWKNKKQHSSPLAINPQLKSILLQETPWVLNAKNQEEQQANLGRLFDLMELANEEEQSFEKLKNNQNSDGGWSWFSGGKSNWFITQYIVEGFGKLKKLGIDKRETSTLHSALIFMDNKMLEQYKVIEDAVNKGETRWKADHLGKLIIHYLYARSLYQEKMPANVLKAYKYYLSQVEEYWIEKPLYEQAMMALTLKQENRLKKAIKIVNSLKERAIRDEEKGIYFKYPYGFQWNQMPIETQAIMIEVFENIGRNKEMIQGLKKWLLKNKQTTHWGSTKATTTAIYALLSKGELLQENKLVEISFDHAPASQSILEKSYKVAQKGTGYVQATFNHVDNNLSLIRIKNPNKTIAWGALYWQYFEQLDKIQSSAQTPLKIIKKLYLIKEGKGGEELVDIQKNSLHVGDKIKVHITIRVDRDMEFIMLKDGRASAFEPTHILSQYRWQDGLGYYESTKDNASYFFIDYLPKGTYIFEYPLFVSHKGQFSGGIASIESMYAPEFRSHSKGEKINVK